MIGRFPVDVDPHTGLHRIRLEGRIDSLTSVTVKDALTAIIDEGERRLLVDLANVVFLSSAGIRVFLMVQKQLRRSSGELILVAANEDLRRVFKASHLTSLFILVEGVEALPAADTTPKRVATEGVAMEVEGIALRVQETEAAPGRLRVIGSHRPLMHAGYTPDDVCAESLEAGQYAVGLAAAGERFEDYGGRFGEALVVDGNFFVQPAVPDPRVDYILREWSEPMGALCFLHGIGFAGDFRRHLMFEDRAGPVGLDRLQRVLFQLTDADLLGVVLVAESLGHRGMALRRVPMAGSLTPGASLADPEHLADWLDFSIEPAKPGRILIACGLLARDRALLSADTRELFPPGSDMHLHALVLQKGHLSRRARDYARELSRVLTDPEVDEVCHLLKGTSFRAGLLGMIELEA